MSTLRQASDAGLQNRIVGALPPQESRNLWPLFRPVAFQAGDDVSSANFAGDCLFIERGIVSVRYAPDDLGAVEVDLVGTEGMLGLAALLGAPDSDQAAVALTAGEALAIAPGDLRRALDRSTWLQVVLLQYAGERLSQTLRRSACHLQHQLEDRLADWLLAVTDRLGEPRIAITHRQLAAILGATRPGVTLAIQDLEGRQAIRARRNLISVRSREVLGALACHCCSGYLEHRRGEVMRRAEVPAVTSPT